MKKIILGLLFAASLGACEKKIVDISPIDLIPAEKAIQNMTDVQNGVFGVYGTWSARRSVYISSLISDEVRLGTGTEYRNVGNILFNWQHVSDSQDWRDGETGGVWTNLYVLIDRANRILELMVPIATPTPADVALKVQLRGELLALRGFAHLELLKVYGAAGVYDPAALGVTVLTSFIKTPGTYKSTRNTYAQVMASVNADFAEARTLIPTTFTDIGRVTRNAVIGMQVKAALFSGQWQNVIDRATEVLALQPISTGAAYTNIWVTRTLPSNQLSEVLWKLNIQQSNLGANIGNLWQDNPPTGAVQASPAEKLMNTFDRVNDIRFNTFFKTTGRNLIAKYGFVNAANPSENFQYDIKMLRSSDMLLARAEAYAELNNLPMANADLNALRAARITGYVSVNIMDKATLVAAIINERYKELAYEGNRYFDLKRKGLPIVRDLSDVANIAAIQTLQPSNDKYILPIPQQEMLANPTIQQNKGY